MIDLDAPAIAKLAAKMRARAVPAKRGHYRLTEWGSDLLTILDALDAADARMKELGDAATERFDKLNERIAELTGELAEARRERDEARNGVALLKAASGANARIRRRMRRIRFYDPEKALGELGHKFKHSQWALNEMARRLDDAEARAAKLRETVERLCEDVGNARDNVRRMQRYASRACAENHRTKCAVLAEELNALGNVLNRAVAEAGEGRDAVD